MRLDFPGAIFASSSYPSGLVIKDNVIARSSCLLGYLVVDFESQEAHIYEVELCDPYESHSFDKPDKWRINSTKLCNEAYQYLIGMREQRPKFALFSRSSSGTGRFCVLRTKSSLILLSEEDHYLIF